MQRTDIVRKAEKLLTEPIRHLGYELVACDFRAVSGRPTLQVFVDREGGVDINDCVTVNRGISDLLDVEDIISGKYDLEVSSPGLDRPLRREADFIRFAGHEARVRTFEPIDGRRNFRGRIGAADDGIVELGIDGTTFRVPVAAMERANLVVDPFDGVRGEKKKK